MRLKLGTQGSLITAIVAAVVASLCCVGPLVLLLLGIGGAWLSNLTVLAPIRPFAMLVTLIFLGFSFFQLYLKRAKCAEGKVCTGSRYLRVQRILFWVITVILLALLTLPWYAYWFY